MVMPGLCRHFVFIIAQMASILCSCSVLAMPKVCIVLALYSVWSGRPLLFYWGLQITSRHFFKALHCTVLFEGKTPYLRSLPITVHKNSLHHHKAGGDGSNNNSLQFLF